MTFELWPENNLINDENIPMDGIFPPKRESEREKKEMSRTEIWNQVKPCRGGPFLQYRHFSFRIHGSKIVFDFWPFSIGVLQSPLFLFVVVVVFVVVVIVWSAGVYLRRKHGV